MNHSPASYEDNDAYAHAQAINARNDPARDVFAIGGTDEVRMEIEYAIEPSPGNYAMGITDEIAGAIEEIDCYQDGARLITRAVTYGMWRYVTPEEIEAAQ